MNGELVNLFPRSRKAGNGERAFVVIVLLFSMGAFLNLEVTGQTDTQNMGMLGKQILWAALYLVVLVLYWRSCNRPIRTLFIVSPLIAVVVFAFTSTSWSQDPILSARRSIALGLTLVFGVYLALRFSLKEQLRLLVSALAVCIVFSFVFELLGLNPSQGGSEWYGVFYIKNQLGETMALGALIFLFWKEVEPEKRALANVGVLCSVVLLLLSRAMTALVVFIVLIFIAPYLRWTMSKSMAKVFAGLFFVFGCGTVILLYLATHLKEATAILGKDPDMTGRVPLWVLSTAMALRRPWLGYGFNAFWLPTDAYVQRIWLLVSWKPPQAHNGVLELWLELGLVGVGLYLLVFGHYLSRALWFLRRSSEPGAAWPLTFLAFFFLQNLTTAFLLQGTNIYFTLYASIAATMYMKWSETHTDRKVAFSYLHA